MENKRRIYKILLVILCLCVLGLSCIYFYKSLVYPAQNIQNSDDVTLKAIPIYGEDVVVVYHYVGHVEAINQVLIVPYISGYLDNIAVQPGQKVSQGELLITIDDAEYKAKADAAEAAVMQSSAALDYAQNFYNRVQKSGRRAFSEIDIDNAKNNFLQAQAAYKSALANKKFADVNLNYTQIKAPISGIIGNFNLSVGDYVAPVDSPLLRIVQTDPIRVVFSLSDNEYLTMKDGQQLFKDSVIKLTLANGKTFAHEGQFKYTDNRLNKGTNSLAIYAYFQNENEELMPEAFVTVDVYKTFKNAVILDKNLVKFADNGYFLSIGRNQHIENVRVDILSEKDNQFVIKNIFYAGDLLILDTVENIKPGTHVNFNIVQS